MSTSEADVLLGVRMNPNGTFTAWCFVPDDAPNPELTVEQLNAAWRAISAAFARLPGPSRLDAP